MWQTYRQGWRELPPGLKTIATDPEPVLTIETLRLQCDVVAIDANTDTASGESHPADPMLLGYLATAVEYAESVTGLAIALRTYEMALDQFPWSAPYWNTEGRGITLMRPPVIEIVSVLCEGGGSEGELDQGDHYTFDDYRNPPRLLPVSSWPTITRSSNAIKIRYRAGYSNESTVDSDAQPLPAVIRQALLLLVRHFYENPADGVEKALTTIPHGVMALLGTKRIETGFA